MTASAPSLVGLLATLVLATALAQPASVESPLLLRPHLCEVVDSCGTAVDDCPLEKVCGILPALLCTYWDFTPPSVTVGIRDGNACVAIASTPTHGLP